MPKITENFIKKVEKLQKEEKQEWYKNNETFWWGGVDYCSVSMLYDVLAGKYTTKT
ncbi:hypothetical protein [Spiroplasma endosymbiont of Virgichneumon dumeticola]|uniref:hypothetical protein n=1 Tax=Spiroplasma endosymbiont of Virgichneumon dumeticola TaxID=3139323 RepID=UPI0035C92CAD